MFWVRARKNGYEFRLNIDDDSRLQEVMDMCHKHFGEPGKVLDIPDKLPEPRNGKVKRR